MIMSFPASYELYFVHVLPHTDSMNSVVRLADKVQR